MKPIVQSLEVDGQTYTLTFDLQTALEVERETGLTLPEAVRQASSGAVSVVVSLMRCCLRRRHPEMDRDQTIALLQRMIETGQTLPRIDRWTH